MLHKTSRAAALVLIASIAGACDSGTDPDPGPASVELETPVQGLFIGDTTRVTATVLDTENEVITDPDITFESNDEDVATVDQEGLVTGQAEGAVTISATAGAVSDAVLIEIFDPEGPCFVGSQIEVPGSVEGTLEEGDCDILLDDGSFFDIWFFELDAETDVTITLSSDDFNAYLFLEDDDLNPIDQDDDSGEGTDAEIDISLSAGTYWLLANHYPPNAGDYTITIETDAETALRAGEPTVTPGEAGHQRIRTGIPVLERR